MMMRRACHHVTLVRASHTPCNYSCGLFLGLEWNWWCQSLLLKYQCHLFQTQSLSCGGLCTIANRHWSLSLVPSSLHSETSKIILDKSAVFFSILTHSRSKISSRMLQSMQMKITVYVTGFLLYH